MIKVIKNDAEYKAALDEIERIIDADPAAGSPGVERLELLVLVVREYESNAFQITPPDPLAAIQFRMEQQDLAPRDLIPYLGSRSKVSEILSGKRPLSLSMIRALHEGLGIPASVLIQGAVTEDSQGDEVDWNKFPLKEMIRRGWAEGSIKGLKAFFAQLPSAATASILYRRATHIRSARSMDHYSLGAWTARIITRARATESLPDYRPGSVNLELMRELAKYSAHEHGPSSAMDFLRGIGIPLIVEPHLPYTYLDGAAILVLAERPIVGLSLRYDRLDNFWFTLMHELAHIALHSEGEAAVFVDDLDVGAVRDQKEREADDLAGEALIPEAMWRKSPARGLRSADAAYHLAKQLGIHPAIVAGKMRHHWKAFRMLNNLVGHREVRSEFPEANWKD